MKIFEKIIDALTPKHTTHIYINGEKVKKLPKEYKKFFDETFNEMDKMFGHMDNMFKKMDNIFKNL